MRVVPITLATAKQFVRDHHRHNKAPTGHKFSIGLESDDGVLIGVATCGRPIARHFDTGRCLEVNRTCTVGAKNANSMLYGAARAAAKAMGYDRVITYTQADECGASLRAAGFVRVKELPARGSWAESTTNVEYRAKRDPIGSGHVARVLWEIRFERS